MLFRSMESLNAIAQAYDRTIIVSTHPRTRKKIDSMSGHSFDKRIKFMKPFGLFDYVKLQKHAMCVVSDSGTITEESSILNVPAVTIRQAHERPEGMDEGTLIMCGLEPGMVVQSINVARSQCEGGGREFRLVSDYDVDNLSKKVLRIIMSYTDYVNRTVWFK